MDLRSGMPYSLIKSGLPFNYPKLENDRKVDVVIVGAGITGAICAYYFAKSGIQTLVVDGRTVGLGSTCANTSLLQYEIDTPLTLLSDMVGEKKAARTYLLCAEAINSLQKIDIDIGLKNFQFKKSFQFASTKKDSKLIEAEYEIRKKWGFNVDLLSKDDIEKNFPFSAPSGLLSHNAAQTDAYLMTNKIFQFVKKLGVEVYDRTPITSFNHHKTYVELITSDNFKISAKKIIYATGYESVSHIKNKIVELKSTYAIASEQFNHDHFWGFDNCMIWETAHPYLYIRTTSDNRILVGGKDDDFSSPSKRDRRINLKRKYLEESIHKKFPEIPFKTEFSWCGTFGETKDGLPYVDEDINLPNGYFALGFGGNGIIFSVVAAEIIRDYLLGKDNKDCCLFRFERPHS